MQITCDQCQSKFKIPDEKIPPGKVATVPCPKCKGKITIGKQPLADIIGAVDFEDSERPFSFIEEEGKTALICEQDDSVRNQIAADLKLLEYNISVADSTRDALKKMRYHVYDLIILNEAFDSVDPDNNGVLIFLARLNMATRRNIFVGLLSHRLRTMDHMTALSKSVNVIVNLENIKDLGKILQRSITEFSLFYRAHRDTLKKLGRL
ncbi:MAG: zinc-ribbon domain-containing protein [Deltaproteobacteria bacterium]|nr:zinc-ribbon domain-containing protein [Deltaproteobacteria bacterium]